MATAQNFLSAASAPVREKIFYVLQGGKKDIKVGGKAELLINGFIFLLGYMAVMPVFFFFLFLNLEKYNFSKKRIAAFFVFAGGYAALAMHCYYSELALKSEFAAGYLNSVAILPLGMLYLAYIGAFKKGASLI